MKRIRGSHAVRWLVIALVIQIGIFIPAAQCQQSSNGDSDTLLLTDFTECELPGPYVDNWGCFEAEGAICPLTCLPAALTENCQTPCVAARGEILKVEYNVERKGSYCGLYMQWHVDGFNWEQWNALNFYIRCEQGCLCRAKIELKIRNSENSEWGWRIHYLDGISDVWQLVSIPLGDFKYPWSGASWYRPNEFVITFEHDKVPTNKGTLYVDDIFFRRW